jgi:hypothetical protein
MSVERDGCILPPQNLYRPHNSAAGFTVLSNRQRHSSIASILQESPNLWLINGGDEEENRYAKGSSGQLQGIFTRYGGAPEMARAARPKQFVAFR